MTRPLTVLINVMVQIGGWSLLACAFLVTYDVIARKLFGISIAGADEISGYVFAISTAFAYCFALVSRANIRIDFLYNTLPAVAQRLLDIASMALVAGFFGVICYYAFGLVQDAYLYNSRSITPLQTPLILPQALWFAGLCLALLTALFLLVRSLVALIQGEPETVKALIGAPSLDEEIKAEIGSGRDGPDGQDSPPGQPSHADHNSQLKT
ncbi:MAG: TRAP transporter small permease subunit [Rhodospirillaceae bacterium]